MKGEGKRVILGLEKILTEKAYVLSKQRVGLICNQASVNHQYQHAADLFFENGGINLVALFGPQHGIRGDVQDNMVESKHCIDLETNLPIYSLYSETREPTEEMLQNVDTLVFDLQDVGCRVYTFIYTMANAMQACSKFGKKMVVLDRPNPINGSQTEGNVLEIGHESFVGKFPIPMRHGLTVGELALLFNEEFNIKCDLEVIEMDGWDRKLYLDKTDAPWAMPSPNMPTIETAAVFPGTVFLEGTEVSEGRGTTRPFEVIGAPYVNSKELADCLNSLDLPGVIFRSISFLPTFQKHAGTVCEGVFLHVTDREVFKPVLTGCALIKALYDLYKGNFSWKTEPYEYEFERNPFDVIAGTKKLRNSLESQKDLFQIEKDWETELKEFDELRKQYFLY